MPAPSLRRISACATLVGFILHLVLRSFLVLSLFFLRLFQRLALCLIPGCIRHKNIKMQHQSQRLATKRLAHRKKDAEKQGNDKQGIEKQDAEKKDAKN
ncbi:hypothetical protein KUW00_17460 [Halomonas sp. DP5N14-9]|uniref:hypothetical protein n=1 Tax=Halomonas sp. DP5N14-9 TaxID=2859075 RepID=UPI001C994E46|nr:hypothetical protein [Halomonas sp. DP5N14-9]MBY5942665.1 hypothetical protein [Halomonas sp. DP5N14-9]